MCFVGIAIHEFKIPTKYLFAFKLSSAYNLNPQIQVSINISIPIKQRNFLPMKMNDFQV